ncbi:unnamed protein product [Durusdinium trenchii]|uniref:Uncharacterized protein n=1 Tax=Durusdinium trenchii TaxID=1381693 RepID=A0ABP0S7S7_9DINO
MIASLSRQLQGARLDSRTRRSLQRDSHAGFDDRLVTLTQRPMTRHALGASAVGFWLLIPLSCMLVDRRFQVSLMLILWSMMAFCLILCGSAKCSSPEHMQGERKRPPRLSEVWPGTYQETKMLLFLLGICSSLACVISLTKGGALMLSLLRSPSQDGCSVAELKGFFSRGLSAFRCEDGNLDSKHEGTVLLRHGWSYDAAQVYRMAPVYLRAASQATSLPVAWAVAKDGPLASSSCGSGLCGLFLRPSADEAALLGKLAKEMSHTLGFSKQDGFHLQSMPLVALTDPSDPFGSKRMLSWAVLFYFLALLTLLAFQLEVSYAKNNDYEPLATKSLDTDTEGHG